jgi:hypothetical protein
MIYANAGLARSLRWSSVSFRQACVTDLAGVDTVELCATEGLAGNRGQPWLFLHR